MSNKKDINNQVKNLIISNKYFVSKKNKKKNIGKIEKIQMVIIEIKQIIFLRKEKYF